MMLKIFLSALNTIIFLYCGITGLFILTGALVYDGLNILVLIISLMALLSIITSIINIYYIVTRKEKI